MNTDVATVLAAYLSKNTVAPDDIPKVAEHIRQALSGEVAEPPPSQYPGVPARELTPKEIRDAVQPESILSFEDGKRYKTLGRHLGLRGLTPQTYRAKWGLPVDFPMTAAAYSERRSQLAKGIGLGQKKQG